VLASESELIDDIRRAPDDVLSGSEARNEVRSVQNGEFILMRVVQSLQAKYTLDILNPKDGYLAEVFRSRFTRDVCKYFRGGPRRTHHGNRRFDPDKREWCVVEAYS